MTNPTIVHGDYLGSHEDITLTRPVIESDREWIEALFPTTSIWSNPGVGYGTPPRVHFIHTLPRSVPVRSIPCHPTHPLV